MSEANELDECTICLDSIQIQGVLDCCQHDFCYDCIIKWSSNSNTCPLCKKRFHNVTKKQVELKKNSITTLKRVSDSTARGPNKKQKTEVTKVPFRDLMQTQVQPAAVEAIRQQMAMTQQFMETLRQFMLRREYREVDGVIDLTEEGPRSPPRFVFPRTPLNAIAVEPIDITDDTDMQIQSRPLIPQPRLNNVPAVIIDLCD